MVGCAGRRGRSCTEGECCSDGDGALPSLKTADLAVIIICPGFSVGL